MLKDLTIDVSKWPKEATDYLLKEIDKIEQELKYHVSQPQPKEWREEQLKLNDWARQWHIDALAFVQKYGDHLDAFTVNALSEKPTVYNCQAHYWYNFTEWKKPSCSVGHVAYLNGLTFDSSLKEAIKTNKTWTFGVNGIGKGRLAKIAEVLALIPAEME